MVFYEYGFFNETEMDKEYYKRVYRNRGFRCVKVKRIKTDTKGLKMYEISVKR